MKIEYKSNKLKKQLGSASDILRNFGVISKRLSGRLDDIVSSPTLNVLIQIKAAGCHPLSGDRNGQWAVSVSGNWRLVFEINHNPVPLNIDGSLDPTLVTEIKIIEIEDYH